MLYIVATPIGNLADFSQRACDVLKNVDLIATEDTRHTKKLLNHFNINKPLFAIHAHNENHMSSQIIHKLKDGLKIALVSDAGTPLISDPGLPLVQLAQENNIPISPIPGPCALISALCVSGIPTDKFIFEGFLPAKDNAREKRLHELKDESRTIVFYESPHRIISCLNSLVSIFGKQRLATITRELTKTFETIYHDSLNNILEFVKSDPKQRLGELVLIISGNSNQQNQETQKAHQILTILQKELPLSQAASIAAKITGLNKKELYQLGLND